MFRTRNVAHALLLCGLASGAGAQSPYKVLDIYPGPQGSYPNDFTRSGNVTFFTAVDPAHGRELWRSDGTAAGTVLVKDITPGPAAPRSAQPDRRQRHALLRRRRRHHGTELWKSDGTAAGTVLVKDIRPGSGLLRRPDLDERRTARSSSPPTTARAAASCGRATAPRPAPCSSRTSAPGAGGSSPTELTNVDGTLFFAADDGAHGVELWKSDGTAAGTVLVADIRARLGQLVAVRDEGRLGGTGLLRRDADRKRPRAVDVGRHLRRARCSWPTSPRCDVEQPGPARGLERRRVLPRVRAVDRYRAVPHGRHRGRNRPHRGHQPGHAVVVSRGVPVARRAHDLHGG